jgi:cyclophilin family peptidyl-prolyl cis-trans isomerase
LYSSSEFDKTVEYSFMERRSIIGLGIAAVIFILAAYKIFFTSPTAPVPVPTAQPITRVTTTMMTPPPLTIDKNKTFTATLTTAAGPIVIGLNAKETPITVNNFVFLARSHFYDGTVFHRVIKGFMIQGGDPKGDGTGGPGYSFADEPFSGDYTRGTVAMANSGPNTNGSQFFIMHADNALPKNYVIFGQVMSGLDTVDKIAEAPVVQGSDSTPSKPVTPVAIQSVTIEEK